MAKNFEFDSFYYYIVSSNYHEASPYENKITASQYKIPIEITANYLQNEMKVLDWSCGNGHFSNYLCYKGIETVGTSFYNGIPDFLQKKLNFNFVLINEKEHTCLPFDDKTFDIVFSIGVLEHVHEMGGNQESSLNELHRILKNNGKLFCFHLPNKYSWVENIGKLISRKIQNKLPIGSPHSKTFTYDEIQLLLSKNHFTLLDYKKYSFLPKNFARSLPKALVGNDFFTLLFTQFDNALSFLFPNLCSQSYFIAQKRLF